MSLFANEAAEFVYVRTYSRWIEEEGRRETWPETVNRYIEFIEEDFGDRVPNKVFRKAREKILSFQVMPSMRFLWGAGPAARASNVCIYNCAFLVVDGVDAFAEMLYILMHGTGGGFSVERKYTNKLPVISRFSGEGAGTFVIPDNKEGWADSVKHLMQALYTGRDLSMDYSKLRPRGARLKTGGGRCLSGDTVVYKDRKKAREYNEITIKDLYDFKISEIKKIRRGQYNFNKIKLRSLDENNGIFFRNKIIDVVYNGKQPIYCITTKNGYSIKATENHRFLRSDGEYEFLANFDEGDLIAVNGSKEKKTGSCIDCQICVSRRAIRCKSCFNKKQIKQNASHITARQRKECRDYAKNYCEECGCKNERFEIHHIDKNPHNNSHENLLNLCSKCHRKLHAAEDTYGDSYSHKYLSFDEIISIDYVGEEDTYDLEMDSPYHNFVANGFISHNSSGPEPLVGLHEFIRSVFSQAQGRKLTSLECQDLMNKIADIVVVGGVRRSSQLSLSDLDDEDIAKAKFGENVPLHRAMSNNSTIYHKKPGAVRFMKEWALLAESGRGERGIFNLEGVKKLCPERRDASKICGCNPCAEIDLRNQEFCNLSEVVIRSEDDLDDVLDKIETASWLGAIQSTYTHLPYLNKKWKQNCREERLLGVSLTGQMDNPELLTVDALQAMKKKAIKVAKKAADKLGINMPAAITCVKPSGTVSRLVNSASGCHPRRSKYMIRRFRISSMDPLFFLLRDQDVPLSPETGQREKDWRKAQQGDLQACSIYEKGKRWSSEKVNTWVVEFPIAAPDNCVVLDDMTAIQQLEHYKKLQQYWCEHNTSMTCVLEESDWPEVCNWVYKNWKFIHGISFLPKDGGHYEQLPEEPVTKEQYEELLKKFPKIDYSKLSSYETEDNTTGSKEIACGGGSCDIL